MAGKVMVEIVNDGFCISVKRGDRIYTEQYKVIPGGMIDCIRGNFEDEEDMSEDLVCALFDAGVAARNVMTALEV